MPSQISTSSSCITFGSEFIRNTFLWAEIKMKTVSWIKKVTARMQTPEIFNCSLACLKNSRNNISWQTMMKGHLRQPFCHHTCFPSSSGHTGEACPHSPDRNSCFLTDSGLVNQSLPVRTRHPFTLLN